MQKYQDNVQTLDGRAIVGASVTVTEFPGGAPATVYNSNGSGVITQPILTNGDGEFAFYAANGRYQLQVTGGGISVAQTITDIVLFDPDDGIPASDLEFVQDGAGTVTRTQQDKSSDALDIFDFIPPAEKAAIIAGTSTYDAAGNITSASVEAKASKRRLIGYGKFRLGSSVDLRMIGLDLERARFEVAHAGIGLFIGGDANNSNNPEQIIGEVLRTVGSDSTTTPTVRAIGVKGQRIRVNRTTYFQVYADTTAAVRDSDYSSAYSTFELKYIDTLELTNNPANAGGPPDQGPGGTIQWINENQFHLNRCFNILVNGTYTHNHNKFYNGTLEGSGVINVNNGTDNWFYGIRFEGGPSSVIFGSDTRRNVVEITWQSSNYPALVDQSLFNNGNGSVTDNGLYNQVYKAEARLQYRSMLARATIDEPQYNNRVGLNSGRAPYLQRISALSGTQILMYSPMQSVVAGDVYEFKSSASNAGDTLRYRPALAFFDKDLKPVSSAAGFVFSGGLTTVAGNVVTTGTGVSNNNAVITAAGAAGAVFVRSEWRSSNTQTSNGLARILELFRASISNVPGQGAAVSLMAPVVSAIPTQSFAPVGFSVNKSDGLSIYIVSFSLDTNLVGAVTGGATSIVVASASGVANGDIIGVNLDNRDTHWTTVNSVAGTTIGLTAAMPSASADLSRVVFNRWATK